MVVVVATLYDYMFMYVGLYFHCAVVFYVFCVLCRPSDYAVEFYETLYSIGWLIY